MDIQQLIDSCDFDAVGQCSASALECRSEVRDMCAADRCQQYGKNWACPPACGELDYFAREISTRETCYVVQSFGELEDSFDFETMIELEKLQKERLAKLNELVKERYEDALVLSAGACGICAECSYPNAPCRFPERALVSMEAAGLVVSDVCTSAGIPYNHGPNTIAYTSCVIL